MSRYSSKITYPRYFPRLDSATYQLTGSAPYIGSGLILIENYISGERTEPTLILFCNKRYRIYDNLDAKFENIHELKNSRHPLAQTIIEKILVESRGYINFTNTHQISNKISNQDIFINIPIPNTNDYFRQYFINIQTEKSFIDDYMQHIKIRDMHMSPDVSNNLFFSDNDDQLNNVDQNNNIDLFETNGIARVYLSDLLKGGVPGINGHMIIPDVNGQKIKIQEKAREIIKIAMNAGIINNIFISKPYVLNNNININNNNNI